MWKRKLMLSAIAALLMASAGSRAGEFTLTVPSDDRWHYPFNFNPGTRTVASCFGTAGTPKYNDRDGIMIVAWQTAGSITPGLPPEAYGVRSVVVTLTNKKDASWLVDLTPDEWFTYDVDGNDVLNADGVPRGQPGDVDGESDDVDPGRPLELFGAGFGPFYTPQSWNEFSIFVGAGNDSNTPRDPFPFAYQDASGELLHVEDNVKGLHNGNLSTPVFSFTPQPWAIGSPVNYTPGNQPAAFDVTFDVDLELSDGRVRRYFQEQLSRGKLFVVVTSLLETVQQGSQANVYSFFTKESLGIDPAARAPRLDIHACVAVAPDFDRDCDVDDVDLGRFQQCQTGPALGPVSEGCEVADFDRDQDVDQIDFGVVQRCLSRAAIDPVSGCES